MMNTKKLIGSDIPFKIAKKDISKYLHDQECNGNLQIIDKNGDVWVVTPTRMSNSQTTKLNHELGIHKVNKHGNKMNRKQISK